MNIWYFHHYGTPYEIPGMHRPFEFSGEFNKKGNKTAVFASSYLHYGGWNMINDKTKILKTEYDGVDTVFIKTCGYENKLKRVMNMVQYWRKLFGVSKWFAKNYWKPDIIIASSPHPLTMLAGIKIAKKLKVPCVCEVRDFWPEVFFYGNLIKEKGLIGRILLWGERRIYEKADRLLFLKEGDHTYITERKWDIDNGGKVDMSKCSYVNNGVDIELFDKRILESDYEDEDLNSGKFNVVYCGTIRPVNNIGMLLDVAKLIPDVNFLIYGTGNCVDDLKVRIQNEKIKNVMLKGYVDNKYVPAVLSKSSLNILNYSGTAYNWSRGNSSNKLFEYLASGKPVLSTVKMGYDIIEKYSCGYSVEECTAENIADAIKRIKELPEAEYELMCKNARIAAGNFDIRILANEYMKVLEDTKNNYRGEKK